MNHKVFVDDTNGIYCQKFDAAQQMNHDGTGLNYSPAGDVLDEAAFSAAIAGAPRPRREGKGEGSWVLLDFIDLVVHVQLPEARATYDLERLWRDQPQLALPDSIAEI